MPQTFIKDPSAVLDYSIDWAAWLEETSPIDTISTSTWTVQSGITQDSESETASKATVWLSGGTAGAIYEVVNRIVTAAGRTDDRTLYIQVMDK